MFPWDPITIKLSTQLQAPGDWLKHCCHWTQNFIWIKTCNNAIKILTIAEVQSKPRWRSHYAQRENIDKLIFLTNAIITLRISSVDISWVFWPRSRKGTWCRCRGYKAHISFPLLQLQQQQQQQQRCKVWGGGVSQSRKWSSQEYKLYGHLSRNI